MKVLGTGEELNQALERAGRVADFFELGELMCIDALVRRESCGGHFRAESQTEDGEALRHDDEFAYVSAWEFGGEGGKPVLHKEPLVVRVRRDEAAELQVSTSNWQRGLRARGDHVNITVRVWRQADRTPRARWSIYQVPDISEHMSFLEMLDVLNERLTLRGDDPIAFDSDCREGICGSAGW